MISVVGTELAWDTGLNAKPKELSDELATQLMKLPGATYIVKVPYLRTDIQRALMAIGFCVKESRFFDQVTFAIDTTEGYP